MVSVLPGPGRRPRWRHTPRRSLTARGPSAAARTCAAAERRLELLARCPRAGGETLLCDKGYAGREFAAAVAALGATVVRPRRADEPGRGPHLAPIRQRTRVDLPDLQGPAHPGALPLPGGLHQPQPPAGTTEPRACRLLRL